MRDNLASCVFAHAHSRKFLFLLLFILVIMVTVLAACSGGSAQTTSSKYSGNISVGLDADVVTLDPLHSSLFVDRQVMLNIYDTLVKINEQDVVVPDLAT